MMKVKKGRAVAKPTEDGAGKGWWRKRMLQCNVGDSCDATSRKAAHFHQV